VLAYAKDIRAWLEANHGRPSVPRRAVTDRRDLPPCADNQHDLKTLCAKRRGGRLLVLGRTFGRSPAASDRVILQSAELASASEQGERRSAQVRSVSARGVIVRPRQEPAVELEPLLELAHSDHRHAPAAHRTHLRQDRRRNVFSETPTAATARIDPEGERRHGDE